MPIEQRRTPRVLLTSISGGWPALLRLPSMLRAAGVHVTALVPVKSKLRWSRSVDQWLPAPRSDPAGFVDDLRAATTARAYDWVATTDDPTIALLAGAADHASADLQPWFDTVLPLPRDRRPFLTRKAPLADAGARGRVRTPRSVVCASAAEIGAAAESIGLPVIVKADQGYSGNGVIHATNRVELDAAVHALAGRMPVIVQPFLDGRVGSTVIVCRQGQLVAATASYQAACFPEPFGPSCTRVMCDVDGPLLEMANAVAEVTGLHGVGGIDWIDVPGRTPMALEFNVRPVPTMHLGHRVGVDVAAALGTMLGGEPIAPPVPPRSAGAGEKVCLFPKFVHRAIAHHDWASLTDLVVPGRVDWPWREPWLLARQTAEIGKMTLTALSRAARAPRQRRTAAATAEAPSLKSLPLANEV